MPYLLVRHKVEDFACWKRVFDANLMAAEESGLELERLVRNVDDPNEVVLWFVVTDLEKARGFISAPEAYDAKDESGVCDEPDCYFLE